MRLYQICPLKIYYNYDDDATPAMEIITTKDSQSIREWISKYIYHPKNTNYQPLDVISSQLYKDKPLADISFLYFSQVLVLSQKAVDILYDLLEDRGDLLKLNYQGGQDYFAFCEEQVAGALNIEKCYGTSYFSKEYSEQDLVVKQLPIRAFCLGEVQHEVIFSIPESPSDIFVNQEFKNRVESSDLVSHIAFPMVWDSENPDFVDEVFRLDFPESWQRQLDQWKEQNTAQHIIPPYPLLSRALHITSFQKYELSKAEIVRTAMQLYREKSGSKDDSPYAIVEWIDAYVDILRQQGLEDTPLEEWSLDLSILWGEQVVRHYGWIWEMIDDEASVVASDKSRYIVPRELIGRFLFNDDMGKTVIAATFAYVNCSDLVLARANEYVELFSIHEYDGRIRMTHTR